MKNYAIYFKSKTCEISNAQHFQNYPFFSLSSRRLRFVFLFFFSSNSSKSNLFGWSVFNYGLIEVSCEYTHSSGRWGTHVPYEDISYWCCVGLSVCRSVGRFFSSLQFMSRETESISLNLQTDSRFYSNDVDSI